MILTLETLWEPKEEPNEILSMEAPNLELPRQLYFLLFSFMPKLDNLVLPHWSFDFVGWLIYFDSQSCSCRTLMMYWYLLIMWAGVIMIHIMWILKLSWGAILVLIKLSYCEEGILISLSLEMYTAEILLIQLITLYSIRFVLLSDVIFLCLISMLKLFLFLRCCPLYNIQMEGVRVFTLADWEASGTDATSYAAEDLKKCLEGLARHLFGKVWSKFQMLHLESNLSNIQNLIKSTIRKEATTRWLCYVGSFPYKELTGYVIWFYIIPTPNPPTKIPPHTGKEW